MLIWEIAEEKIPYLNYNNPVEIRTMIKNGEHEPFSENVPEKWKEAFYKATSKDPKNRSKISEIMETLCNTKRLLSEYESRVIINFTSFKFELSLEDAIKEYNKKNGDIKKAWECFREQAELGISEAKFWAGLYLVDGRNEISAAKYFKECAEEINKPEAQLYYGYCLWNGKGVEKNIKQAIEYFEKASTQGNPIAMFNYGGCLYHGIGIKKNEHEGMLLIKQASKQVEL
ncbi:11040_t:CDS:2, partial [Dentiscutata erythropus]